MLIPLCRLLGGTTDEAAAAGYCKKIAAVLDVYEQILSKQKYIGGDVRSGTVFGMANANSDRNSRSLTCTTSHGALCFRSRAAMRLRSVPTSPGRVTVSNTIPVRVLTDTS